LMALAFIWLLALYMNFGTNHPFGYIPLVVCIFMVCSSFLFVLPSVRRFLSRWEKAVFIVNLIDWMRVKPGFVAILVLQALALQFIALTIDWLCYRSIGLDVTIIQVACVFPAVTFVTMIPISLGGFGLREASSASLMSGLFDFEHSLAIAAVFSGYLMVFIVSLPGWWFFWKIQKESIKNG
jgi:uncharacterized membrane protein YbhN (UPF0104 family)